MDDKNAYPDNNPKTVIGITKPSFHAIPPAAMIEAGAAMADGKNKYGLMNYRDKAVSMSVYYDAMLRHLFAWWDGENRAQDSGVHHLGHVMACCAIMLDTEAHGSQIDDRPTPGPFSKAVTEYTLRNTTALNATKPSEPEEKPQTFSDVIADILKDLKSPAVFSPSGRIKGFGVGGFVDAHHPNGLRRDETPAILQKGESFVPGADYSEIEARALANSVDETFVEPEDEPTNLGVEREKSFNNVSLRFIVQSDQSGKSDKLAVRIKKLVGERVDDEIDMTSKTATQAEAQSEQYTLTMEKMIDELMRPRSIRFNWPDTFPVGRPSFEELTDKVEFNQVEAEVVQEAADEAVEIIYNQLTRWDGNVRQNRNILDRIANMAFYSYSVGNDCRAMVSDPEVPTFQKMLFARYVNVFAGAEDAWDVHSLVVEVVGDLLADSNPAIAYRLLQAWKKADPFMVGTTATQAQRQALQVQKIMHWDRALDKEELGWNEGMDPLHVQWLKTLAPATGCFDTDELCPTKSVYIAGPMRGYDEFNFPMFHAAELDYAARGLNPFNPGRRDIERHDGVDISVGEDGTGEKAVAEHGFSLRTALGEDTAWICQHGDAIAMLPGWEDSRGAQAEIALARALQQEVNYWSPIGEPSRNAEGIISSRDPKELEELL